MNESVSETMALLAVLHARLAYSSATSHSESVVQPPSLLIIHILGARAINITAS